MDRVTLYRFVDLEQSEAIMTTLEKRRLFGNAHSIETTKMEPRETVVEIRKDSDGRKTTHKYLKGKLLGKVSA